jgi:hypothetical protein
VSDRRPTATAFEPAPAGPSSRRPRGVAALGAVVVVLVVAAIAVAVAPGSDDDEPAASPSPTPTEFVAPPATPLELEATAGAFEVELQWEPDPDGGEVAGYTVYRDGREIATVGNDFPGHYVDDEVAPELRYRYAVAAFGPTDLASDPAEVRVRTESAPLGAARVEGTFAVRLDERSTFGYRETSGDVSGGWRFQPTCRRGSCDVVVKQVFRGSAPIEMEQRGASYRAHGAASLGVRCGGVPSRSTYVVELRVTGAETVDDVWRAVTIEGRLRHREAPQRGCVAGGADLTIDGRLVDV